MIYIAGWSWFLLMGHNPTILKVWEKSPQKRKNGQICLSKFTEGDGFPGVFTIPGQPTSRRYTALSLVSFPSPGPHWQHIGPYPNTGDIFFASRLEICPQGLSVATTKWIEAVISSLKVSLDGCLPSPIPQLLCFMCVCMCLCLHMWMFDFKVFIGSIPF